MREAINIDQDMDWLRQVNKEVDLKNDDLTEDIEILDEYCKRSGVFAMAAGQLGINKRIIYLKNTDLDKVEDDSWNEKTILINPVIIEREGLTSYWEACASCLDNTGLVLRPYKIKFEYYDLDGKKHEKVFEGFPSTVLSHEYDHLNGVLHIDKALEVKVMNREERKVFRETHGYDVISKDGDFEKLEKEYVKEYKNKCDENSR